MAAISKSQLWKQLKSGEVDSVYLFFGPEKFQRNLALRNLVDASLGDESFREFNENVVNARDQGIQDALAACEQLPFGGGKRVVVVRDFYVSSNRMNNSVKEDDIPILEAYLKNPSPETVLIFVAEELDKRLKTSKLITKSSTSVEFAPLRPDDAVKWAKDRFKEFGIDVDQRVARELVNLTGEDAGKIAIESKKLAAAAQPDGIVTVEMIHALVSHSREISNFALTNDLIDGKSSAAVTTMLKLLDDGVEPLALLGMLSYSFRQLVFAKEMMNRGFDRPAILKRMGFRGNPNPLFSAARKAEAKTLASNLIRIAEADIKIKTSVGDARTQIEMLVCELAIGS